MSPAEYGVYLARDAKPLTPQQVETAARILASIETDVEAA